jgi:hypothetical protein
MQQDHLVLDHIAVVATSLEAGLKHVEEQLDITVPPGGQHPKMGTHNRLMSLGGNEYMEIIAIDPDAPKPDHPRWFGFDFPLSSDASLATWIVGTSNIQQTLKDAPAEMGKAIDMARGDLHWQFSTSEDGRLPFDGTCPTLIEWPEGPHPSGNMTDLGCRLLKLTISHPNMDEIEAFLKPRFSDQRIVLNQSDEIGLEAQIQTSAGTRVLR